MRGIRSPDKLCAAAAPVAAALGILHLWAAWKAPVVRWSDIEVDLDIARGPLSALRSIPVGHHPIKPAFILFLKLCLAIAGPGDPGRVIVVANTLVWLAAISAAGFLVGRSTDRRVGWGLVVLLLAMLRFRDNASAVMSETLTASILLVIGAGVLAVRRVGVGLAAVLAVFLSALFWIRPNVGAVAIALTFALAWRKGSVRSAAVLVALLLAINAGVWVATSPTRPGAALRGLDYPIALGSIDDAWDPQLGVLRDADDSPPAVQSRLAFARASWGTLVGRGISRDTIRQWSWRAVHGLFSVDYYDASWSRVYGRIDAASRAAGVFLLFAAIGVLLASRTPGGARGAGLAIVAAVIAQDLVFFSEPRLAAPLLPVIFLMAACVAPGLAVRRAIAAAVAFVALCGFCAWQPSVLSWPWGRIEKSGVVVVQAIPRGALPRSVPATLHVRMASPTPASGAGLVLALGGSVVYRSDDDACRARPEITVNLPEELVKANRARDLALSVTSHGRFDATSYYLFPVIPPPWKTPARRVGSSDLSPSTGLIAGALDWWAHEGAESVPCSIP